MLFFLPPVISGSLQQLLLLDLYVHFRFLSLSFIAFIRGVHMWHVSSTYLLSNSYFRVLLLDLKQIPYTIIDKAQHIDRTV